MDEMSEMWRKHNVPSTMEIYMQQMELENKHQEEAAEAELKYQQHKEKYYERMAEQYGQEAADHMRYLDTPEGEAEARLNWESKTPEEQAAFLERIKVPGFEPPEHSNHNFSVPDFEPDTNAYTEMDGLFTYDNIIGPPNVFESNCEIFNVDIDEDGIADGFVMTDANGNASFHQFSELNGLFG